MQTDKLSSQQFPACRVAGVGIAAMLAVAVNCQPRQVSAALIYADNVIAFSSQYSASAWSAAQALGAPNTAAYGDFPTAWSGQNPDGPPNPEFITLGYSTPIFANRVIVWETNANGFVTQIDLLDTSNSFHTVFAGGDPSLQGMPVGFNVTVVLTAYEVKGVKITIDPVFAASKWEQIDAVGLGGTLVPELAGDFNGDEAVNAADYVVWRKNAGTPADYNLWRTHFGQFAGSGSGITTNAVVPEPSTIALMLILRIFAICSRRRRVLS